MKASEAIAHVRTCVEGGWSGLVYPLSQITDCDEPFFVEVANYIYGAAELVFDDFFGAFASLSAHARLEILDVAHSMALSDEAAR